MQLLKFAYFLKNKEKTKKYANKNTFTYFYIFVGKRVEKHKHATKQNRVFSCATKKKSTRVRTENFAQKPQIQSRDKQNHKVRHLNQGDAGLMAAHLPKPSTGESRHSKRLLKHPAGFPHGPFNNDGVSEIPATGLAPASRIVHQM